MSHTTYWFIASGIFLLLEAFGIPGIGFLFAGIAALAVAALISLGLIADEATLMQLALFAILTSVSAALLWKKLKNWRINPKTPQYSNIIGTEATVVGSISGSTEGQVRWSGTLMRARLADTAATLTDGAPVIVTAAEGNLLTVKQK